MSVYICVNTFVWNGRIVHMFEALGVDLANYVKIPRKQMEFYTDTTKSGVLLIGLCSIWRLRDQSILLFWVFCIILGVENVVPG